MTVYVLTKIFGVDCVKTRVFYKEENARKELAEDISVISENGEFEKRTTENREEHYIISRSQVPEDYIEIVFKKCEVK